MGVTIKVTGPRRINMDLPVTCPRCSTVTKVPMRSAEPGTKVSCGGCGCVIELAGDDVREVQAEIDTLLDAFHKLGK